MFWSIVLAVLGFIGLLNIFFLVLLVVAGLLKGNRPLTRWAVARQAEVQAVKRRAVAVEQGQLSLF